MASRTGSGKRTSRSTTNRSQRRTAGNRGGTTARARSKTQARSAKANSGRPGGGAGRRERVERTGVYPMSGPLPPDNAPVKPMASWGQGERGAAGYEDSGRSELYTLPPGTANQGTGGRRSTFRRRGKHASK